MVETTPLHSFVCNQDNRVFSSVRYLHSHAFTVRSSDHPLKYPKPNPNPSLCIVLIVAGDQSSNHHHPQSQMGNLSISQFLYSESSLGYCRVCSKWDDAFQVRFMDRWLVPVRWEGKPQKSPNKIRRRSPEAGRTSGCSTTAVSSPPVMLSLYAHMISIVSLINFACKFPILIGLKMCSELVFFRLMAKLQRKICFHGPVSQWKLEL